jgi:integrative and conjugative element protein (TIGR02256 family)
MARGRGGLTMNSPIHVFLAYETAYAVIEAETLDSPGVETGGILVGRQLTHQGWPVLVVLGASGPGPSAQKMPLSFEPDHVAHQRELDEWRHRYARYEVDFIGMWHKHPPEIPRPTAGDLHQTRDILEDPSYVLPDGGLLIPIAQLLETGCQLHMFYVSRDQPRPRELPYQVVVAQVLEQFMDEYLAGPSAEQVLQSARKGTVGAAEWRDGQPTRWGHPPRPVPRGLQPYDFTTGEGPVIIGQYRAIEDVPAHAPTERRKVVGRTGGEPPSDSMAQERLSREVQRLEWLGLRYDFELRRSPGSELKYVELVFAVPVPMPQLANDSRRCPSSPSAGETADATGESHARPRPGELVQAIRIAFPYEYPAAGPLMWVCGERDYPVKLAILREHSGDSLDQLVEVLLRWLLALGNRNLPGLVGTNVEFLCRRGVVPAMRDVVDTLDDLVTALEERAERQTSAAGQGPSPI